jgi:diaminopimelate decarboxylase
MSEPSRSHSRVVPCGAVQAGIYNTRPLVPEVLVKGDQAAVIRPRIDVDMLITMDQPPLWL